jgi:hypothetical protein
MIAATPMRRRLSISTPSCQFLRHLAHRRRIVPDARGSQPGRRCAAQAGLSAHGCGLSVGQNSDFEMAIDTGFGRRRRPAHHPGQLTVRLLCGDVSLPGRTWDGGEAAHNGCCVGAAFGVAVGCSTGCERCDNDDGTSPLKMGLGSDHCQPPALARHEAIVGPRWPDENPVFPTFVRESTPSL